MLVWEGPHQASGLELALLGLLGLGVQGLRVTGCKGAVTAVVEVQKGPLRHVLNPYPQVM